jgi:hypothetical protein
MIASMQWTISNRCGRAKGCSVQSLSDAYPSEAGAMCGRLRILRARSKNTGRISFRLSIIVRAMCVPRLMIGAGFWLAAMIGGCAERPAITLSQPQLAGMQQELCLRSEQVAWSEAGGPLRIVGEFPLPGASTGRAAFELYLRLSPTGCADDAPAGTYDAHGFLIQARGENAGLAMITGGSATVSGASQRWVELDLSFEDGSSVTGSALARHDEHTVRVFERDRHPADVRQVTASSPSR